MKYFGETLRTRSGNVLAGALVTVLIHSSGLPAALTDDDNNPIANPVTTDGEGRYEFNVADGTYDLLVQTAFETYILASVVIDAPNSSASITALAALTPAADMVPYFTSGVAAALTSLTAYARTLIAATTAAAARTVLGLGTMATQAASGVLITGGFITVTSLSANGVFVDPNGPTTGQVIFYETLANGADSIALRAPTALAASTVYDLPAAYPGVSGYVLSSTTAGVMSWVANGGVSAPSTEILYGTGAGVTSSPEMVFLTGNPRLYLTAATNTESSNFYAFNSDGAYVRMQKLGSATAGDFVSGIANASLAVLKTSTGNLIIHTESGDTVYIGHGATNRSAAFDLTNGITATPVGAGVGQSGRIALQELAANGTNVVGFKAPDALAGNTFYVMPTAYPASDGYVLSSTAGGILAWSPVGASTQIPFGTGTGLTQSLELTFLTGNPRLYLIAATNTESSNFYAFNSDSIYIRMQKLGTATAGNFITGIANANLAVVKTNGGNMVIHTEGGDTCYVAHGSTISAAFNASSITLSDSINVVLGTSAGTKFGTSVSQLQSLWNKAPIVQPAHANQAAITDSTGGTPTFTLVDVGAVPTQANINDNFASLARQVDAMRTAMVNYGSMKGAA